jgi:hypothetical protein
MPKQVVKLDKAIIEATRGLMEAVPAGASFKQIYDAAFGGDSDRPSPDRVFAEINKLVDTNEGLLVRTGDGLYTTPDLDDVAVELDVLELIDSI